MRSSPSLEADPTYVVHGAMAQEGARLFGWCWSPDRPAARLQVAICIDGRRIGGFVAARLWHELVSDGVCDGYHAFSYALPSPMPAYSIIEAQESATGQVFGRVLAANMAVRRGWSDQIDTVLARLRTMHADCAPAGGVISQEAVSTALGQAGRVAAQAGARNHGTSAAIAAPAGVHLPFVAAPAISVLMDATNAGAASLASLVALAPVLGGHQAELLVSDDGCGAMSAALAGVAGRSYVLTRKSGMPARINAAARAARGSLLMLLRPGEISALAFADLLPAAGRAVLFGRAVAAAAADAGLGDVFAPAQARRLASGLLLAMPLAQFLEMGGLEPAFDDRAGLPMVAFVLRVLQAGLDFRVWNDHSAPFGPAGPDAAAARQSLVAYWSEQ